MLPILILFNFFFYSVYISTDYVTLFSLLDLFFVFEQDSITLLINLFYLDLFTLFSNRYSYFFEIFQSNNQNLLTLTLLKNPEVFLVFAEFLNSYFSNYAFSLDESAAYSSFIDNLMFSNFELLFFLNFYVLFVLIAVIFVSVFSALK